MNSTTPKRHAKTFRNRNIPFQLKKRNTYKIDSLGFTFLRRKIKCLNDKSHKILKIYMRKTS